MAYSPYLVLLTLGLVSSFHCVGMCGGIMGALGLSTPQAVRQRRTHFLAYVFAYNAGRVLSYSLAGGLVWLLGALYPEALQSSKGHLLLRILGAAMMLAAGLHLSGWFPDFKRMEVIGRPLWQRLEPVAKRLLPVKSLPQALAYGALWGWLPCGLVYMALLYAVSQTAVANPVLMMAGFGLGTLPVMLATGFVIQPLLKLARSEKFRRIAGVFICLLALASVAFVPDNHAHHMTMEPTAGDHSHHHHHH